VIRFCVRVEPFRSERRIALHLRLGAAATIQLTKDKLRLVFESSLRFRGSCQKIDCLLGGAVKSVSVEICLTEAELSDTDVIKGEFLELLARLFELLGILWGKEFQQDQLFPSIPTIFRLL
jgi:hypothetical protein